jgi:hypothetical protein
VESARSPGEIAEHDGEAPGGMQQPSHTGAPVSGPLR